MEEKIDDIEVEINQNIISNGKKIKKRNQVSNGNNFNVLTKEQFELMKKIRDETISRTERYSEMVSGNKSNDGLIIPEGPKKKKKIKSETSQKNQSNSDTNINIKFYYILIHQTFPLNNSNELYSYKTKNKDL